MDALGCAFLPTLCALCGSSLPRLFHAPICAACSSEIPVDSPPACGCCGESLDAPPPVVPSAPEPLCRSRRLDPPPRCCRLPFVRVVSFGPYSGRMRGAAHVRPYDGLTPAARQSGQMLASASATLTREVAGEMLVVLVPLRRSKSTAHGFNQAHALAVEVLAHLRKTRPEWCLTLAPSTRMRRRAPIRQAGPTLLERRLNVGGALRVSDPATVAGKHLLVVDDILTTGASARATGRALLQAGAETVWIATLARRTGASVDNAFKAADDQAEIGAVPDFRARLASMYSENQPSF